MVLGPCIRLVPAPLWTRIYRLVARLALIICKTIHHTFYVFHRLTSSEVCVLGFHRDHLAL